MIDNDAQALQRLEAEAQRFGLKPKMDKHEDGSWTVQVGQFSKTAGDLSAAVKRLHSDIVHALYRGETVGSQTNPTGKRGG